ncbi:MAG: DUF2971 domain-containing protein [Candidatus Omnitrophota bacterium]
MENGVITRTVFGNWKDITHSDPYAAEFQEILYSKKVCALSKNKNDILLWAHYANGHSGIAIEIDIPNDEITFAHNQPKDEDDKYKTQYKFNTSIYEVEYAREFPDILDGKGSQIRESQAYRALITKLSKWEYEGEFRIIQDKEYYLLPDNIKTVYCGCNINPAILNQMVNLFPKIKFLQSKKIYQEPWIAFDDN